MLSSNHRGTRWTIRRGIAIHPPRTAGNHRGGGLGTRRHENARYTREGSTSSNGADMQELDTLKALRASLESIKQVVQGIHDDLSVSQENMTEFARTSPLLCH